MEVKRDNSHTVAEIEALPEGQRAEIIDGVWYDMAAPTRKHQRIITEICTTINNYIKQNNGKCEVNVSPFAVYLNDDDMTYVEPDIVVVCDENKLDDRGCHGAPDWLIEVVSEDSISRDYMVKLFKYQNAGVKEYWIVDPLKQMVRVYDVAHELTADYGFEDSVQVGIYDGLKIRVEDYQKQ